MHHERIKCIKTGINQQDRNKEKGSLSATCGSKEKKDERILTKKTGEI